MRESQTLVGEMLRSVDVTRMSAVARNNLEKESDGQEYSAATAGPNRGDVRLENPDAELDFEVRSQGEEWKCRGLWQKQSSRGGLARGDKASTTTVSGTRFSRIDNTWARDRGRPVVSGGRVGPLGVCKMNAMFPLRGIMCVCFSRSELTHHFPIAAAQERQADDSGTDDDDGGQSGWSPCSHTVRLTVLSVEPWNAA